MQRAKILAAAMLVTAMGATPALANEIEDTAATTPSDAVATEAIIDEETAAPADQPTVPAVEEEVVAPETDTVVTEGEEVVAPEEATTEEAEAADEGTSTIAANEIENYVKRLYVDCLGRAETDIDTAGFNVQVNAMKNGMAAAQIALNFFQSAEFESRGLTNEQAVLAVYKSMFDVTTPDPEGKKMWTSYLDNHMSIAAVVKGFSESEQYLNNCEKWGVTAGTIEVTEARDKDPNITKFAWGLYKNALGRADDQCDVAGLNAQCQGLLDGMSGSLIARNFFQSAEFESRGLDIDQQVEAVYQTMLQRASDKDGFAFWKSYLEVGASIDAVVCGFSQATEWVDHCDKLGITTEQLTPINERDKNIDVTRFVYNIWMNALGHAPNATQSEERCKYLNEGRSASAMIVGIFESPEFLMRSLSSKEIIDAIWAIMVDKTPNSNDYASWTAFLTSKDEFGNDRTAKDMAIQVSKTNEFKAVCQRVGITRGYAYDPYDGAYQSVKSNTNCFILIDTIKNQLVVYERTNATEAWNATHVWSCSTGAPGMDTVKGAYTVTGLKGLYFDDAWGDRCWYYTQFYGDFLMHSVLYEIEDEPKTIKDGTLGANVSHGCVRLTLENAKWIYDYVPAGSTVFVF